MSKEREPFKKTDWRWTYEAAGMLGWSIPQLMDATLPEIRYALSGALRIHGFDPDKVFGTSGMSRKALEALMDAFPDDLQGELQGDLQGELHGELTGGPAVDHASTPTPSQAQARKPSDCSGHEQASAREEGAQQGHAGLPAYMRRRPFS